MIRSYSILILDDEPRIRATLIDLFVDMGCKTSAFETAQEALDALGENPCDLAIVDMRLPDMNGESFIRHAHALHPGLRFVIHTGSLEFQDIHIPTSENGPIIEAILHKPLVDMQPLIDIIDNLPASS